MPNIPPGRDRRSKWLSSLWGTFRFDGWRQLELTYRTSVPIYSAAPAEEIGVPMRHVVTKSAVPDCPHCSSRIGQVVELLRGGRRQLDDVVGAVAFSNVVPWFCKLLGIRPVLVVDFKNAVSAEPQGVDGVVPFPDKYLIANENAVIVQLESMSRMGAGSETVMC